MLLVLHKLHCKVMNLITVMETSGMYIKWFAMHACVRVVCLSGCHLNRGLYLLTEINELTLRS